MSTEFSVVVNGEEQYSVWADGQAVPAGWRAEGFRGSRQDCLDHIERVWTDLRPASLRGGA
ncbi:MbtH family protein [Actinokineospora bangkokensis]|uniref:Antibiotic synthesis protein MbtH n=1 Tax=Actinokineospora bangkokensis TaxID=1193682 RepID=A0A1Q9LRN5_9PSEU|nr:MbtH family NRPS accessory protein [Actinokineospora bangkokensis]OLR94680.1 antibiotic synthesis protein MbtH [Actinokineospora bangkokensis]